MEKVIIPREEKLITTPPRFTRAYAGMGAVDITLVGTVPSVLTKNSFTQRVIATLQSVEYSMSTESAPITTDMKYYEAWSRRRLIRGEIIPIHICVGPFSNSLDVRNVKDLQIHLVAANEYGAQARMSICGVKLYNFAIQKEIKCGFTASGIVPWRS